MHSQALGDGFELRRRQVHGNRLWRKPYDIERTDFDAVVGFTYSALRQRSATIQICRCLRSSASYRIC
jgi:hypothetical protein